VKLTFIESRGFTEKLRALVDDEAYRAFQNELQSDPQKGDLIKETGGVRKVRMRLPGRGKSGSARVIYLYLENHALLYLLTLYTKKEQADLSPEQKKAIRAIVEEIKRSHRPPV
jgi:mRNA-degrading endonuclease RelE of RelBE toxin-antitoxin system